MYRIHLIPKYVYNITCVIMAGMSWARVCEREGLWSPTPVMLDVSPARREGGQFSHSHIYWSHAISQLLTHSHSQFPDNLVAISRSSLASPASPITTGAVKSILIGHRALQATYQLI